MELRDPINKRKNANGVTDILAFREKIRDTKIVYR
jgi:hypothetical protein